MTLIFSPIYKADSAGSRTQPFVVKCAAKSLKIGLQIKNVCAKIKKHGRHITIFPQNFKSLNSLFNIQNFIFFDVHRVIKPVGGAKTP